MDKKRQLTASGAIRAQRALRQRVGQNLAFCPCETARGRRHAPALPLLSLALLVAAVMLGAGPACPDSVRLSLSANALTFPSADPDATPVIAALENPVDAVVTVRAAPITVSQLTIHAGGDLVSGADRIPIERITWTAAGQGFLSGTLSSGGPQLVGTWVGRVDETGQLQFWLENSWSYAVGDYSQDLVYTLIAY